jgi:hypothetical protein
MNIFNIEDYKNLNKDLNFLLDIEYFNHWDNIGFKQRRLCNKELLYVLNEFGIEILFNIGYYYYLYKNNLLFDNKICTYSGMEAYYYFLPKEQIIYRKEERKWINPLSYKVMVYANRIQTQLNPLYWIPPKYKEYYKNNYFNYDKEILVINNKYNIEWGQKPINFINITVLNNILNILSNKYIIIYIRPNNKLNLLDYSVDHGTIIDFYDFDIIRKKFKDVIIFDDLLKQNKFKDMDYNLLKCYLFSSCDKYISVQGGGNNLISYFAKNMIIYHKRGFEASNNIYSVRSQLQCVENNLKIQHTDNYINFIDIITKTY